MRRKWTFCPKSKNVATGKALNEARDRMRMKPPHLPEVVPCGAANEPVIWQVLQPAPPGFLLSLDYHPPNTLEVVCVLPPQVNPMQVVRHVYCLLPEVCPPLTAHGGEQEQKWWKRNNGGTNLRAPAIGQRESDVTAMLG
jgi:hypothetical protein